MEHKPKVMVNCEIIGPMEECPEQYHYILNLVDQATRYCVAISIRDGSVITIEKAILCEVVSKFGLIDYLVSDSGLNFTSPIVQHLSSLMGSKHILMSAYGLVELFYRVLKKRLVSLVGDNPET